MALWKFLRAMERAGEKEGVKKGNHPFFFEGSPEPPRAAIGRPLCRSAAPAPARVRSRIAAAAAGCRLVCASGWLWVSVAARSEAGGVPGEHKPAAASECRGPPDSWTHRLCPRPPTRAPPPLLLQPRQPPPPW